MGIKGLLPFLSNAQRNVNVSSFKGQTVAVDAYCWLHKGAYSCAMQLVMKTEKCENLPFVRYCMKRINLLCQYDITPIVVFDGANLPMKHNTEKERRERRKSYLQKGKALLKDGRQSEAYDCFQKCVDVSPEMALVFIKELRKYNIQVVVAPYEADAELAYLVKEGIAHFVITEDSDLLAFGCPRVLYKMTDNGDGKLIEYDNIGKSVKSLIGFTPDSFRHVCILGGCDYLQSIPGVGVATAVKLMRKHNKDPYNVIKGLKRGKNSKVPSNYEEDFHKADDTFLYQVVYDPRSETQVRLTTPHINSELSSIGIYNSPSKQVGLARGNINPLTLETMDTFSPTKQDSSGSNGRVCKSLSWTAESGSYPIKKQSSISVSVSAKEHYKNPLLKKVQQQDTADDDDVSDSDLKAMYGVGGVTTSQTTNQTSPSIICRSKYFRKTSPDQEEILLASTSCSSSLLMLENHSRLKEIAVSNSANGIITNDNRVMFDEEGVIFNEEGVIFNEEGVIFDEEGVISSESRTNTDNESGLTSYVGGAISNGYRSSDYLVIDETNNIPPTKRMCLELSENSCNVKRLKLDFPTSSTILTKRPLPKKKPILRLGLSKKFANDSNKGNKILSYFCYKRKDKLAS